MPMLQARVPIGPEPEWKIVNWKQIPSERHTWPKFLRCLHCSCFVRVARPSEKSGARGYFARADSNREDPNRQTEHSHDCRFNAEIRLAKIARRAGGLLTRSGNRVYLMSLDDSHHAKGSRDSHRGSGQTQEQWRLFLRTAADIAKLKSDLEDAPGEWEGEFYLRHKGQDIEFGEFYFETDQIKKFAQKLGEKPEKKWPHPVALELRPEDKPFAIKPQGVKHKLGLTISVPRKDDGQHGLDVSVWARTHTIFADLHDSHDPILVYSGDVTLNSTTEKRWSFINMNIKHQHQWTRL
ncbi:MAG: hypothetical protein ACRC20_12280 [Segniliparus sp.]|uniref:hypothetical protein n=1 Tax=Segniliparus sp. TaxID=2804064 RepID=UPI003F32B8F4